MLSTPASLEPQRLKRDAFCYASGRSKTIHEDPPNTPTYMSPVSVRCLNHRTKLPFAWLGTISRRFRTSSEDRLLESRLRLIDEFQPQTGLGSVGILAKGAACDLPCVRACIHSLYKPRRFRPGSIQGHLSPPNIDAVQNLRASLKCNKQVFQKRCPGACVRQRRHALPISRPRR